MRSGMILTGAVIVIVGAYLLTYAGFIQAGVFALVLGIFDVLFGLVTRKSGGVSVPSVPKGSIWMVVDKGAIGASIYLMVFSDQKLVLRRLTSGRVTILAVIVLAVAGYLFGGIIGVAVGGITAFYLQEFLTQRRRDLVRRSDVLSTIAARDLEFLYQDVERIQLTKSRFRLFLEKGVLGIVISRRYPRKMLPVLEKMFPSSKLDVTESVSPRNASEEEKR